MDAIRRLAASTAALAVALGAGAALAAGGAHAGGFATAGLSSTPEGLRAGEPWRVDVTVLAHGRTPAVDLRPRVLLVGPDGARRSVAARETDRPGVYRATVTFPTAGRWRYALDDGYGAGQRTTFPPVRIAAAAGAAQARADRAGDGGAGAGWWWAAAAAVAIAAGAAATAVRVRRGRGGAGARA
jgi:hypothetical protein